MAVSSSSSGTLVGRDDERDRLRHLLAQSAIDGSGRSVWIEGEPGIGKSVLLESFLAEAKALGRQVRHAKAEELGRRIPLRMMAECLGAEPGADDPELAEIADLLSGGGSGASADPAAVAAERLLCFAGRLASRAPIVLAVDDLQWADEASVLLLHRLSRLAQRRPLLIVGACRPVPRRPDLATLKRGLAASGAEVLNLGPLEPAAVARLVTELTGARGVGDRLRRAAERAGGNPLYLKELVGALVGAGRVALDDDGTAELTIGEPATDSQTTSLPTTGPQTTGPRTTGPRTTGGAVAVEQAAGGAGLPRALTDAIADRLGFLSPETVELLRSAALLGSTFSVTDLGAVVGRSALELTAALEEATDAGVLAESELLLAFRHTIIRQALYERPPAGLRVALHLQAARALADAGPAVERVAEQLLAALRGPGAVPVDGWTIDWLLRAGRALVSHAPRAAAELLRLAVAGLCPDDPRRESLEVILAPALVLLGHRDEAVRLAEKALAAPRDPLRAAEMSWAAGWALTDANRHAAARSLLGRALQAPDLDDVWAARLHAMLARAAVVDGDLAQADAAARTALALADRTGDRPAAAAALNVIGILDTCKGDLDAAAARFDRGMAVAELCEDPETHDLRLRLRQQRAYVLLAQLRLADADIAARELLNEAECTAFAPHLARARILNAEVAYQAGRWDDAVTWLDAAAKADALLSVRERQWLHGLAAVIAVHRDDQVSAEEHLAAVPECGVDEVLPGAHYMLFAHALLAERRELTGEALGILTGLLDAADRRPGHRRPTWLPTLLRLALHSDEAAVAQAVEAARAMGCSPGLDRHAAMSRTAVAEHCTGLRDADYAALERAVEAYRAAGRPLQLAHALEDTAVVLAEGGDLRAARAAHAEASELYTSLGATWDLVRADTRLRRHGVRPRRGSRRRAVTGWDALTPAELTVARLVADGRPNPDIAACLFVSRRTVEVHVSHILSKLGVRSRVEIAREATHHLATTTGPEPAPSAQAV